MEANKLIAKSKKKKDRKNLNGSKNGIGEASEPNTNGSFEKVRKRLSVMNFLF